MRAAGGGGSGGRYGWWRFIGGDGGYMLYFETANTRTTT